MISSFFSSSNGRRCTRSSTRCTGRGADSPAEPLPRARRMSIVSAMSFWWWPNQRARAPARRSARLKNAKRATLASSSLGSRRARRQRPKDERRPSAAHTFRQNRSSASAARPRSRWLKCKATSRRRRSGQCAWSKSSRHNESAPPDKATAQGPCDATRRLSAQARTAGCNRSRGSSSASAAARRRQIFSFLLIILSPSGGIFTRALPTGRCGFPRFARNDRGKNHPKLKDSRPK